MRNIYVRRNEEDKICRFISMYGYLTLADMEESLLLNSIEEKAIAKVIRELEVILGRHKKLVAKSLFDYMYFDFVMMKAASVEMSK